MRGKKGPFAPAAQGLFSGKDCFEGVRPRPRQDRSSGGFRPQPPASSLVDAWVGLGITLALHGCPHRFLRLARRKSFEGVPHETTNCRAAGTRRPAPAGRFPALNKAGPVPVATDTGPKNVWLSR